MKSVIKKYPQYQLSVTFCKGKNQGTVKICWHSLSKIACSSIENGTKKWQKMAKKNVKLPLLGTYKSVTNKYPQYQVSVTFYKRKIKGP